MSTDELIEDEALAISIVRRALEDAASLTAQRIEGKGAAIAFSGGLDSSILASLLDVPLVSIALEGSRDEDWAGRAASLLGAMERTTIHVVDIEEVERALCEVVAMLNTCSVLDVSIALPLYMLAQRLRGIEVLITGQGADELFGGYKRYEDADDVGECMQRDLNELLQRGIHRDRKVAAAWGITLEAPYLSSPLIEAAQHVSPKLKLKRVGDEVMRKYVLRCAALQYVPEEIAWRKKHALQYSTGLMRAISRLASNHGFTRGTTMRLSRYLDSLRG